LAKDTLDSREVFINDAVKHYSFNHKEDTALVTQVNLPMNRDVHVPVFKQVKINIAISKGASRLLRMVLLKTPHGPYIKDK
jgi:hypothetical protein